MNILWQIVDLRAIPLMIQIGFRNGLKSGERAGYAELAEVHLRHPDWVVLINRTELELDELLEEWASHGKRVVSIQKQSNGEYLIKKNFNDNHTNT